MDPIYMSKLVPPPPGPWHAAVTTFHVDDGAVDVFLALQGVRAVTLQDYNGRVLACAEHGGYGQKVNVQGLLSLPEAGRVAEHFGDRCYVHANEVLRGLLGVPERVAVPAPGF